MVSLNVFSLKVNIYVVQVHHQPMFNGCVYAKHSPFVFSMFDYSNFFQFVSESYDGANACKLQSIVIDAEWRERVRPSVPTTIMFNFVLTPVVFNSILFYASEFSHLDSSISSWPLALPPLSA